MSLETELKKAMGYSDDTSSRCPNCTHCETVQGMPGQNPHFTCTANKACYFPVTLHGKCNEFSAKRSRRTGAAVTA